MSPLPVRKERPGFPRLHDLRRLPDWSEPGRFTCPALGGPLYTALACETWWNPCVLPAPFSSWPLQRVKRRERYSGCWLLAKGPFRGKSRLCISYSTLVTRVEYPSSLFFHLFKVLIPEMDGQRGKPLL